MQKNEWNDDFQTSNTLPKWIIRRHDETLIRQLKYTQVNVVCKIQGYDEDADRYKDIILNAKRRKIEWLNIIIVLQKEDSYIWNAN